MNLVFVVTEYVLATTMEYIAALIFLSTFYLNKRQKNKIMHAVLNEEKPEEKSDEQLDEKSDEQLDEKSEESEENLEEETNNNHKESPEEGTDERPD